MASRARHLRSSATHQSISVDQLFDAAFGPAPGLYRHESLMGWRPVSDARPMAVPDNARRPTPAPGAAQPGQPPGTRIHETAERILVEVEMPKIKADSLYLEISGDLLIIRGERIIEAPAQGQGRKSDTQGPMVHRYVQLPITARPGAVRARLEGNIVRVAISKRAQVN